MVAVQATSPYYAQRVFLCIGKTLEAAGFHCLPYHENVPSFGEWGWYLAWHFEASAIDMGARIRELDEMAVETRYLTPEILGTSLEFGKGWLEIQGEVLENTLMHPVIIDYFREAWKGV
jgi:spermidine synthase